MKRTILTLTLAAQLAAGTAFAQATATETQTGDMGAESQTFGSDWTPTLGLALLDLDGTTVRDEAEIAAQWQTLPDEDKEMVRRDCDMLTDESDAMDTTGSDATDDSAMDTGTADDTASDTGTTDMAEPADPATDATPDTSADTGTAGSDSTMSDDDAMQTINVSETQMQEICDATNDL